MRHTSKIEPIPASIVQAICTIKSSLDAVKKSQRNTHGGYNFASTDDIYAALARKMGEVGLVCLPLEAEHEVVRIEKDGKTSQWLKASFEFVLSTADATWTHPSARRSLYIQITGPQTHQAAQSYAEKAFLRSVFKLPTGDMDLDGLAEADTEEGQVALSGPVRKPRKSSAEGKRDGSDKAFNEVRGMIANALTVEHLKHIREIYSEGGKAWHEMPPRWAELLDDDYETRMIHLRGELV